MSNIFVNPKIGKASELGISLYEDNNHLEYLPNSTAEEKEIVIRGIYKQVLGNAYVMESERLEVLESQLKLGEIGVRGFISALAKSELYRSRFVDNCPRYRSIELSFKHFLGRAPESYEEMKAHSDILDRGGWEAEVDSYIDSDEYSQAFGEFFVPYYRGYKTQTGKSMVGFSHMFTLLRGPSSSDKNLVRGNYSRLNSSLISKNPSGVIPPSSSTSYGGITDAQKLIANVLKVNKPAITKPVASYPQRAYAQSTILAKQNEQQAKIKELKQQLSELSALANIGSIGLNKWQQNQSSSIAVSATNSANLSAEQEIAELEAKVADAQRLANFAESRLNRWRSKIFS